MSGITDKQRAYHLRKMRTRLARLDVNKDGKISAKDFELISDRMIELGKLNEEQAKKVRAGMEGSKWASYMDFDKGISFTAAQFTDFFLSRTPEEGVAFTAEGHNPIFDAIDTDNDGYISVKEFGIFLKAGAPMLTDEEVQHSFNTIDKNKNKKISRSEFLEAARDFYYGVEETEVANVFFGKLDD